MEVLMISIGNGDVVFNDFGIELRSNKQGQRRHPILPAVT